MQIVLITVQSAGDAAEGVLGLVVGVDDGVFNLMEDVADAFEEAFLGGSGDCRHQQGKDESHLHLVPAIYTGSERIIIITDNFCIALFSGVPKLTALYNILQHFLSFTNTIHIIMTANNV